MPWDWNEGMAKKPVLPAFKTETPVNPAELTPKPLGPLDIATGGIQETPVGFEWLPPRPIDEWVGAIEAKARDVLKKAGIPEPGESNALADLWRDWFEHYRPSQVPRRVQYACEALYHAGHLRVYLAHSRGAGVEAESLMAAFSGAEIRQREPGSFGAAVQYVLYHAMMLGFAGARLHALPWEEYALLGKRKKDWDALTPQQKRVEGPRQAQHRRWEDQQQAREGWRLRAQEIWRGAPRLSAQRVARLVVAELPTPAPAVSTVRKALKALRPGQ